jgi:hypothetical protein
MLETDPEAPAGRGFTVPMFHPGKVLGRWGWCWFWIQGPIRVVIDASNDNGESHANG